MYGNTPEQKKKSYIKTWPEKRNIYILISYYLFWGGNMGMCCKCRTMSGVLFLVFGIILLLKDLNVWHFWGINWWTVLFILAGIGMLGTSGCKECNPEVKKKR